MENVDSAAIVADIAREMGLPQELVEQCVASQFLFARHVMENETGKSVRIFRLGAFLPLKRLVNKYHNQPQDKDGKYNK